MAAIEVVYENGVFRPLSPVELPEGAVGEVHIAASKHSLWGKHGRAERDERNSTDFAEGSDDNRDAELPGQRAYRLLMEIAALPHASVDNRTDISIKHDDILYPKHGNMP
ncbi:MAG: antitoxin family protein [Chloroflexota bacterium]|nr:antitoxin family protein [Chloroflexota bacterium]